MIDTKKLHIIKAQKGSSSVSYLDIIINQQQHVWKKKHKNNLQIQGINDRFEKYISYRNLTKEPLLSASYVNE